ncbi:GNAT family N-acetyltransferase [Bogoriella caseilytica]|uniref:Putative GNAT superfamily acetyltransferase n=1 Tax=Bogoriella caseilytica TaxID=56055 RepID=A0A3N2BDQ4_9MICO|nr:GNAT family N-acetyltransferase [Bogoriella caseilytica]ROR73365.1 putative GNAT superfamily acetyltransferase [Bogoriella caseilytica]
MHSATAGPFLSTPASGSPRTDTTAVLDGGLEVRSLQRHEEFAALCQLYRKVFGYDGPDDGLNPRLLANLAAHGGTVVGAISTDGALQAFALGWTAVETDPADPHVYHFSQVAGIAPELQGRGIGRVLKNVQAAIALTRGCTRMRWTYNPLITRNAHFNLDVLGARGRWFDRDAIGPGLDRVTVEWDLEPSAGAGDDVLTPAGVAPQTVPALQVGELAQDGQALLLGLPTEPAGPHTEIGTALRGRFAEIFERGYEAVSCRRVSAPEANVAVYRFERPDA